VHALESSLKETDRDFRKVLKSIFFSFAAAASTTKKKDDDEEEENAACTKTQRRTKRMDSILLLMVVSRFVYVYILRNACKDKKSALVDDISRAFLCNYARIYVFYVYISRARVKNGALKNVEKETLYKRGENLIG